MTLLEKAKNLSFRKYKTSNKQFSDELIELAVAFFKGDIGYAQVDAVMDVKTSTGSVLLRSVLRSAVIQGKVKIEIIK